YMSGCRIRIGPGTRLRNGMRLGDEPRDLGVDSVQSGLVSGEAALICAHQPLSETTNGTSRLPRFDFFPGAIAKVAHAFRVWPRPICLAFEKRCPAAGAGPVDGLAGDFEDGLDIVAVRDLVSR